MSSDPLLILLGPFPTAAEALAHCAPRPGRSLRLAQSVPDGTFLAVQTGRGPVRYCRVADCTGWNGSVAGTGVWREDVSGALQWRPL